MPATPSLPTMCSINVHSRNAVYPSCIMHTSRDHCMGCDPIGRIEPAGPKYSILKPRLLAFETALIQFRGLYLITFPLARSLCGRQGAEIPSHRRRCFTVSQPLSRFGQPQRGRTRATTPDVWVSECSSLRLDND